MVDYIQLFKDRHLFNQCTNESDLNNLLNKKKIVFYIGFDATADALHAGSLVQLRAIKTLVKHGHKAIVLLGGGTTKIGDPSGKDTSRKILTYKELAEFIGKPKAARAIANACGKNPYPIKIPCHRVIRSDGSLGGYSGKGGVKTKRFLLKKEGIRL